MESYDWQQRRYLSNSQSREYVPPRAEDMRKGVDQQCAWQAQPHYAEPSSNFPPLRQNRRNNPTRISNSSKARSEEFNSRSRYDADDAHTRGRDRQSGPDSRRQQDSRIPVSPTEPTKYREFSQERRDTMSTHKETRYGPSRDESPPVKSRRARLITPHSEYDIIKLLESRPGVPAIGGMNSGIFLIEHRVSRELYVEKRLPTRDDTDRARVKSENWALYEIRRAGSCRNVVDVVEAFAPPVSPPYCSLVLEYCNSGTLKDFIDRYIEERKITPEPFAWHVFAGVTSALCACHYCIMDAMRSLDGPRHWDVICHLDVKPSNIFLTSTGRTNAYPRVVLGDFGCAAREEDIDSGALGQLQQIYTPEWLPPENERSPYGARSLGSSFGRHTDVWQAGAVVQAMCRLSTAPNQGLVEEERPCGSRFTFALNNIITCCMSRDPQDRPAALELVKEVKREMQSQGMLC